jgi:uncharacterized protein (DUF362 family)
MTSVAQVRFETYDSSVTEALDALDVAGRLPRDGLIILKPNLTNSDRPPVTTPVGMVEAVYHYCRKHTPAEIAIGDGCGSGVTADSYKANGYTDIAARYGIRLLDFNREAAVRLTHPEALQLKEFYLPAIARDAFVISIPVLKDHSFTVTTVAMKNMFGLAPAPYYAGSWNKSGLHMPSTHRSVVDICLYKKPDLCIVDAVVALTGMHLSGTPREIGLVLAGWDPVAVDASAGRLLGHDPRKIEYLALADGLIGDLEE